MTATLRCYSFHSVKGGVGKSVLSTLTALAEASNGVPTFLVDMDLTGTSLSDVLTLTAPMFPSEGGKLALTEASQGDVVPQRYAELLAQRRDAPSRDGAVGLPFLNDYLLFAAPAGDPQRDLDPRKIAWSMAAASECLHVLPSSALPRDLERILPVVFDEERGAFLEGRLELLLDALISEGELAVVFDTPPTIPGLSRAVLSLAIRLGSSRDKRPLADDGVIPPNLESAAIEWHAYLVSSMDVQDQRAAARWLSLLADDERDAIRWLINRAPASDQPRDARIRKAVMGITRPDRASAGTMMPAELTDESWLKSLVWVEETEALKTVFQMDGTVRLPANWLRTLVGG